MNLPTPPTGLNFLSLSASGLVKTGPGDCVLILITSSSSLNIRLYNNTAASGTVITATMAVDAKEEYDIPAHFTTGLYVEFVSGTGSLTVFYL